MTSAVRKSTPTKRVNPKIHFETSSRPSSGAMNLLGWVADNPLITHVSVEAGKRTARAAGPVRLRIIGGTADAVKITICCDGLQHTAWVTYQRGETRSVLEYLRKTSALEYDRTTRQDFCAFCDSLLPANHGGNRNHPWRISNCHRIFIKPDEPMCDSCLDREQKYAADEDGPTAEDNDFSPEAAYPGRAQSAANAPRMTSEEFQEQLRSEVVAAADREAAKKRKPWWRRLRSK